MLYPFCCFMPKAQRRTHMTKYNSIKTRSVKLLTADCSLLQANYCIGKGVFD